MRGLCSSMASRAIARASFHHLRIRSSGILRRTDPIAKFAPNVTPWANAWNRGAATDAREVRVKHYMSSAGYVMEPYQVPPPPLPFLQRWFTKQGWRILKDKAGKLLRTAYAIAKLKQQHRGYTNKMFYSEVTELYKQINKAFAAGNLHVLRRLVTEMFLPIMKKQIKHREGLWNKVHWEMVGPIKLIRTQQARLGGFGAGNDDHSFVQVTVRVQCYQIFAAYDKAGKLVAGDPEKQLLVEDHWVFERHLTDPQAVWRLCAQLG